MISASWFRLWRRSFVSSLGKGDGDKPRRRAARSPLSLEHLEDRLVPSTAASNVVGGVNNPTVNPAPQSIGVVLPATSTQQTISGLGAAVFPTIAQNTVLGILAATSVQGQLYGQFLAVSVNSQSQSDQLTQSPWFTGAYGFGSGTQPGQPWAPAAYNVGLANHQFSFSSNSDQGFQVPPPWSRSIDYTEENNADGEGDKETIYLLEPAKADVFDGDDSAEGGSIAQTQPLMEHAIPARNGEQAASEASSAVDARMAHEMRVWEEGFASAVVVLPSKARAPIGGDSVAEEAESADIHLSDLPTLSRSLGLSSLTPLQFSALLTGLAMSALQVRATDEHAEIVSEELEETPAA